MPDVDMWLEELGLSEYVAAFKDNAIGFDQVTRLDHDILKDIGVNAVGHRMKILAAAEKIGEPSKLLASTDKKAVQQAKQASEREPEHRQVTVLFADIAEYTPLAEKLGAPVLTTFKAKGLISDAHPNAAGVLGRSGTPIASWFMNEADLGPWPRPWQRCR